MEGESESGAALKHHDVEPHRMALWRYVMEHPDGRREENILAAGNRTAAVERAQRNASARGADLVGGPDLVDSTRGSM